jgi:hypothetical protein
LLLTLIFRLYPKLKIMNTTILNPEIDSNRKNILNRNTQLVFVLLIFSVLYSIFQLADWYMFFKNTNFGKGNIKHYFYYYRLSPLISVVEMALSIISYSFVYRSFKLQSIAVNTQNGSLFNKGLRFFNINLVIMILYFLILFANILFRSLIIKI